HDRAGRAGCGFEALVLGRPALERGALGVGQSLPLAGEAGSGDAQPGPPFEMLEGGLPGAAPGPLKAEQAAPKLGLGQRLAAALGERCDRPAHDSGSSSSRYIWRGPWTPIVSVRSMSALRLGPLTNEA